MTQSAKSSALKAKERKSKRLTLPAYPYEGLPDGDIELGCRACPAASGHFELIDGEWWFVWMSPHKNKDVNGFPLSSTLDYLEREETQS